MMPSGKREIEQEMNRTEDTDRAGTAASFPGRRIPRHILSFVSEHIASKTGLYFPEKRYDNLERGLRSAAIMLGLDDELACCKLILEGGLSKKGVDILAACLTVGETYFFRQEETFRFLEKHFFPELIHARMNKGRFIRVWSAGCATGEEAYSVAILLKRLIPDMAEWNIDILATDINTISLKRAAAGIFSEWSFREETPDWVIRDYFKRITDGHLEIMPSIRDMVTFSHLNLIVDPYPTLLNNTNARDLILCRNVLMYLVPEYSVKVVDGFCNSLSEGGLLALSPTEGFHRLMPKFAPVRFCGAIFYRKDSSRTSEAEDIPVKWEWNLEKDVEEEREAVAPVSPKMECVKKEELKHGQDAEDIFRLAGTLYSEGSYDEALDLLTRLLNMEQIGSSPLYSEGMVLMTKVCANMGRTSEALEWSAMAIKGDKTNPACHYIRAIVLQEQGKTEEALRSLRNTVYLDGEFALAHFTIGNLLLRVGKIREAKRSFENAVEILSQYSPEDIVPESEGMTAARLIDVVRSLSLVEHIS